MAIRTTDAAVQGIIETDSTITLTPFIEVASSMVDDHCVSSGYSAAKLELIERWLAAHFYAVRDNRVHSEKAGSVAQQFQYKVDLGLRVTIYGQQAMLIDSAGNLAAINANSNSGASGVASVSWLGTGDSDGNDSTT
jgi:hypothetical protein